MRGIDLDRTQLSTDPDLDVARGLVPDIKAFDKFGYNANQSAASGFFTVWNGAAVWVPMAAADTLDIVSSSTADDGSPVGTGLRTIRIIGINGSGGFQSVIYTMDGTTPVTTGESWLAINRVEAATVGSTGWNVGVITITENGSGNTQAVIAVNESITHQLFFTVESGYSAYIEHVYMSSQRVSGGAQPLIRFNIWKNEGGVVTLIGNEIIDAAINPVINQPLKNPVKIAAGGFWWIESDTSNNNTFIRGRVTQKLAQD